VEAGTPAEAAVVTRRGFSIHRPIVTGQKQIAWSSVFLLSMVWFTFGFHIFAGGLALTFTLKRYDGNPQVLALIKSAPVIIMLGPFISYFSDKIWTRLGRRRPFLIVSWAAGCLAMFSFAFISQVSAAINSVLGAVGIPPVAEFILLVGIILSYTTLYDLTAPLEPLFLECVPPHQRGRFWAIREILFKLAVVFFFQVLWPVYDFGVDVGRYWSSWFGASEPSWLSLSGEQWIYVYAGALFLITGAFLLFNIVEVRDPKVEVISFRENNIFVVAGRFAVGFVKDVFLRKQNIPFYIVLVIPGIEQAVWGDFGNIMQNDQFKYSKAAQAAWAFPVQMLGMFLLIPLAGFYSDIKFRIGWPVRIGLLLVAAGCVYALVGYYQANAPADVRELPPFSAVTIITVLVAVATTTTFVAVNETMLDFTGREHMRAWVSVLAVVLALLNTVAIYVAIQFSDGKVIPITLWMALQVVSATFGSLLGTFVGPMIYEYMPRSWMGTINAGKGLCQGVLQFGVANLGAWWVVSWSKGLYGGTTTTYDYTSMYLFQFMLFVPVLGAKIWFMYMIMTGRILKWGVMGVEGGPGEPEPEVGGPKAATSGSGIVPPK
jgi:hypothetical protein